jgi:hypothetical protein
MQVVTQPVIHQIVNPPSSTSKIQLFLMLGAVLATWVTVLIHRRNAKLAILAQLLDGYASRDTLKALRTISKWKRGNLDEESRNLTFITDLRAGKSEAVKLNSHRRHLIHYMNKVRFIVEETAFLRRTKFIPKGLRRLLSEGTLSSLIDTLESMQKTLDDEEKRPRTMAPKTVFEFWRDEFPAPKVEKGEAKVQ